MQHESVSIAGLSLPAEVKIDRWGIAHIRAANLTDLFFVQGFNAARDRLWQIDLWRKRGLGLLSQDFGPGYIEQDRAARLFLYRGDMNAEWSSYGDDARSICEAFTRGINAYVGLVEQEPSRLPEEFRIMDTRPARWRPEDVVRIRSHALSMNAISEVIRANVMAKADTQTDLLRQKLDPPKAPDLPEGIDLGAIPLEALDLFLLATAAVTFSRERSDATLDEAPRWSRVSAAGEVVRDGLPQASNAWAIAGARTDSGRPILANDPHRAFAVPSLRYLVHLSAPDFDAIGAGEPALPGICVGHNGAIAFGMTMFTGMDQEDVYVYETCPDDRDSYRYDGGWEKMRVVKDRISVRGAADQNLSLRFTRHGPVVYEQPNLGRAFAIRSVWFEPGSAPYFASIRSMRARSFIEFRAALAAWSVPAINHAYADASGNIGWIAAGRSPIRPDWDGLLPVAGDGRYEWRGFLDPRELPWAENPPSGYIATANEMNLPAGWTLNPHQIGYEWLEASRHARIEERLAHDGRHRIASSCALQTDVVSIPARRLMRLLGPLRSDDGDAAGALTCLRDWNCELRSDSGPAALFEIWWTRYLRPAIISRLVANPELEALIGPGDPASLLDDLERPDQRFGAAPERARDELLLATIASAFRDCMARLGQDVSSWRWGRLHQASFVHALSGLRRSSTGPSLDAGSFPQGGSESTPMQSKYRAGDYAAVFGASVRMVIDVGDWDKSVCMNVPGQSGEARSHHYSDLAPAWAAGLYVPLLYSADAISRETETQIDLLPSEPMDAPISPVASSFRVDPQINGS